MQSNFLTYGCLTMVCVAILSSFGYAEIPKSSGMVAADNPQAAAVGAQILAQGGDAVDAAVATALALGVVHAFGSGIGGGGFAVVSRQNGKVMALDFRETAPEGSTETMFQGKTRKTLPEASTLGPLAIAVPGELAGLHHLHTKYGKLPWSAVVMPAVNLARDGFEISEIMHHKIKKDLYHLRNTALGPYLVDENEAARAPGMRMRLPPLAKTLERIAKYGPKDFYEGEIGQEIVRAIQAEGGLLSKKDLAGYRVKERQPLRSSFLGYEIVSMPPPSSGGLVLIQILKVLESPTIRHYRHNSAAYLHRLAESFKHAFADRARDMGDPDFVPMDSDRFIGKATIKRIQDHFDSAKTHPAKAYGTAVHSGTDGGTSHLSVVDQNGNAVALTTTINTGFGSRFVAGKTGIVMNNEMDDFVAEPGIPNSFGLIGERENAIAPKKRPLSSMTPTIILKETKPYLVIGASGGPMIITSTLQVLLNVLVFGMTPQSAVEASRIHHQWMPNVIKVEAGLNASVRKALTSLGHVIVDQYRFSATQLILSTPQGYMGAADPSKGGRAIGTSSISK